MHGSRGQIAKVNACTKGLLTAFTQALGRHPREPTRGEVIKPVDWQAIYDPDMAPVKESGVGACLEDSTGLGGGAPSPCSVVLCPGPGGFIANQLGPQCSCGGRAPFTPVAKQCVTQRCVDGTLPDSNCLCTPSENLGVTPTRPPGPRGGIDPPP